MSKFTDKHRNDLKLLLDAHVNTVKATLPKYGDSFAKRIAEDMQRPFEAFLAKLEAIRSSGRYSPGGERAELKLAAHAMQEKLAALRADTVAKLEEQLSAQRAAALTPKRSTLDPMVALLTEMRHRELRDHLRTLDPLMLQSRIRQAVDDGATTDLLDALEGAPTGFPIAPPALIIEARTAIALKAHPELGEIASLRDAYTYAIGIVDQTMLAASELSALELGVATTPAPVG